MNTSSDSHGQAQEAFQTFYQEHLGIIYRYVYSKVGNREEAEDLSAQIFMKAARSMKAEWGQQSMQKWLFQVARTTIADYWRNYYRVPTSSLEALLDEGWEGPAEPALTEINVSPVEKAHSLLRLLPEHYREVLMCRFLLNLSVKETAQKLGLTEANVKVLQFRALKRASEFEATIMDKY